MKYVPPRSIRKYPNAFFRTSADIFVAKTLPKIANASAGRITKKIRFFTTYPFLAWTIRANALIGINVN